MLLTYKKADNTESKIRLKPLSHLPPITMGRDKAASIVLDDTECSRVHCAIRYWDDCFVIRDMNSSNGTFLNGKKIDVAKLSPGDIVKIGNTELTASAEAHADATVMVKAPPAAKP